MTTEKTIETAIVHLKKNDGNLRRIIDSVGIYIPRRRRTAFDALARIVIGQQLSGKAAACIYNRVKELNDSKHLTATDFKELSNEEIRKAGVSQAKLETLRNIVKREEDGSLNLRRLSKASDIQAMAELVEIRGIGEWSAHMYLMFFLRRLDIFPVKDMGIRNAMDKIYGNNGHAPNTVKISDKWKPYRTVACWYLWRYFDNNF